MVQNIWSFPSTPNQNTIMNLDAPFTSHSLKCLIHLNAPFTWMTHSLGSPFQQTHSVEWSIHLNDPFAWMTHSLESLFQQTHSPEWPINSNDSFVNDPFTQMTHLLEWPIHLKASFSRPIHLNDPLTQVTHLWMTLSLKWSICLNDPFTWKPLSADAWMTHSLGSPFQQTHSGQWLSDPFSWMTHTLKWSNPHSLEWPIHSNDLFNWMTHSLKWPIHLNDPFACRGEMSVYLSYYNNTIINVDNHLDLVRTISLALWNATFPCIIYASVSPANRVNNTMKSIFLKFKQNISLISYIHYLCLKVFEFYNMPAIACIKFLTCDSFVCSLKSLLH